jgi:hypothetical protein
MPGYDGTVDSAFQPDGTLRELFPARVRRVVEDYRRPMRK